MNGRNNNNKKQQYNKWTLLMYNNIRKSFLDMLFFKWRESQVLHQLVVEEEASSKQVLVVVLFEKGLGHVMTKGYFGQRDVNRFDGIVERRSLKEDAESSDYCGKGEDVEEEAVQYHGHVLPILLDLKVKEKQFTSNVVNEV